MCHKVLQLGEVCGRIPTQEGRAVLKLVNDGWHPKFGMQSRLDDFGPFSDINDNLAAAVSRHAATARRLADRFERSVGVQWEQNDDLPAP